MLLLRGLLMADAAVLLVLGVLFVFVPQRMEAAFRFTDLPGAASYILGLWGCTLMTLALGYVVAALDPVRHRVWVQVGIVRNALQVLVGVVYVVRGVVGFQQAVIGILTAGLFTVCYIALFPSKPKLAGPVGISGPARSTAPPPK
jgi:hypothetical protein